MANGKLNLEKLVNKIYIGDCQIFMRRIPDKSIDFSMTSPPYWQMRDYGIKGQIGQEKIPEEYIEKLVTIFRELKRILKDTGSFYLNLGDTYVGTDNYRRKSWEKVKQLALIPSRVAIALQEDGWILRNDICWHKPNGLPSSVKDRLTGNGRGTVRANVQEICYHLIMRRVRITYPGAYHHIMNRGYDGNPIFAGNVTKSHFLDYLEDAVTEMKMRISI